MGSSGGSNAAACASSSECPANALGSVYGLGEGAYAPVVPAIYTDIVWVLGLVMKLDGCYNPFAPSIRY